jgi:hypothetical protein
MGLGESAIRVIPYLTTMEVIAVLIFIAMLIIIVVMLGKIRSAIEEHTEITRRLASKQDDIANRNVKAEKVKAILESPPAKIKSEDMPKDAHEGYEEFGEMTDDEWNLARTYGKKVLQQSRDKNKGPRT